MVDLTPRADELGELCAHLANWQNEIGDFGRNGSPGHRRIFGFVRILDDDDAAGFLDRLDADRPIRARTRQDYREAVAMLFRERAEEEIDRRTVTARGIEGDRGNFVV